MIPQKICSKIKIVSRNFKTPVFITDHSKIPFCQIKNSFGHNLGAMGRIARQDGVNQLGSRGLIGDPHRQAGQLIVKISQRLISKFVQINLIRNFRWRWRGCLFLLRLSLGFGDFGLLQTSFINYRNLLFLVLGSFRRFFRPGSNNFLGNFFN